MHSPKSWDDKSLLEAEPFLSTFLAQRLVTTKRSDIRKLTANVVQQVKQTRGGPAAAQSWLNLAFVRYNGPKNRRLPKLKLDNKTYHVFVEFYWHLYHSGEEFAFGLLKKELAAMGRWYYPEGVGIKLDSNMPRHFLRSHNRAIQSRTFKRLPKDRKPVISGPLPEVPCSIPPTIIPTQTNPHKTAALTGSLKPKQQVLVVAEAETMSCSPRVDLPCDTAPVANRLIPRKKRARPKRSKQPTSVPLVEQPAGNPALDLSQPKDNQLSVIPNVQFSSPIKDVTPFKAEERLSLDVNSTESLISLSADSNEVPSFSPPTNPPPMVVVQLLQEPALSPLPKPCGPEGVCRQPSELDTCGIPTMNEKVTPREASNAEPACQIPLYKDPLPDHPPIWAETRQEVCESFDWFRSYQGGVYHTHGIVKGYLLSAFSSKRDRFEHGGRLIISHGGGKAESIHAHQGRFSSQPAGDQLAQDKSVRALLRNFRECRPLVLLIDDKYVLFPYDLGSKDVTYAVLGFYMIVRAWAEYHPSNNAVGQVVRYKFAFQWCEGQGDPWWLSGSREYELPELLPATHISRLGNLSNLPPAKIEEYSLSTSRPLSADGISFTCNHCGLDSPDIYHQSWACLNPSCPRFWKAANGQPMPSQLKYRPEFLEMKETCHLPIGFGELRPSLPSSIADGGIITTYAFSRGWHCRICGRLSCRFQWQYWKCRHCEVILPVSGNIRLPKEFWGLEKQLQKNCQSHLVGKNSGIQSGTMKTFVIGDTTFQYRTFILPEARGRLHHILGGSPFRKAEADAIFKGYQEQASTGKLPFRRWPLRSHKCRGTLLTHYFSHNTGEPYQYVGGAANTVPFEGAPDAVIKARDLIQNRILAALDIHAEFNEVLSAAYMERQKMAFHSDSEIGLGPFVAGLSLGAPAMMHFRLHAKHDPAREHRGIAMSFVLRHGDILVMDGADVQEYYEHTVIPSDFRIAATARFIKPEHV